MVATVRRPNSERSVGAATHAVHAVITIPGLPEAARSQHCFASLMARPSSLRVMHILLLSMIFLHAGASAAQVESPSGLAIHVDSRQISLRVCEEPLGKVLAQVEKESGVRVGVAAGVRETLICANVQGETWRQLLKKLLQGYNTAALLRDDGSVARLFVLNQGIANRLVAGPTPVEEGVPETVPAPDLQGADVADKSHMARPAASPPGAPPSVEAPVDLTAEGVDEPGDTSAFLQGLVPPPDLPDLASPPDYQFSGGGKILASTPAQESETMRENFVPPAVVPSPPPESRQ